MLYSELFSKSLQKIGDKEKFLEVQILIEEAFNLSRSQYWIRKDESITDIIAQKKFNRYLKRLLNNEPIAYILKKTEFFSHEFKLNKNVLIPRPETELLLESAIGFINQPVEILDIGAGSGCISVILALKTGSRVVSVEKYKKAIYILKKNIKMYKLSELITIKQADLFPSGNKKYDLIISNPPYLSYKEWQECEANVKNHEPACALIAGHNGSEIIERIIIAGKDHLVQNGIIMLEIGFKQKKMVMQLLQKNGYGSISFVRDYSGIARVAIAKA